MITGINHITLAVRDIQESFAFYTNVMLFMPVQKSPASAYVLAGHTWIALVKDQHVPEKPPAEYTHIAFSVRAHDFAAMKTRLLQAGAVQWQENTTEGDSFYFLDPNGHKLEIHATDLEARIRSGKRSWGPDTHWYV